MKNKFKLKKILAITLCALALSPLFAQAPDSGKAYKIGDIGPGGGIMFDVKDNMCMEVSHLLGERNWQDSIILAKNLKKGRSEKGQAEKERIEWERAEKEAQEKVEAKKFLRERESQKDKEKIETDQNGRRRAW